MVYVFWFAAVFAAYTLAGYPLLLWLLSLVRVRTNQKAEFSPKVSLIAVAHNEAGLIEGKIKNCLELDYPPEQLEILFALDGADEACVRAVRSFAERGIGLVVVPERRGKHYAQMLARDASKGEILVFTDISVHLEPDALRKIVANFADPAVGCVSSEDRVAVEERNWMGERVYVQGEMWLRRLESRVNSLVSASGSFFAARREVCREWHPDQSSDFFIVLHAAAQGFRSIVDPESHGHYGLVHSGRAELYRKVRTIVHGLEVVFTHLDLLNPLRHGLFAWQLMSHKLFRWLVSPALVALFVSNLILWREGDFYKVSLALQAIFYASGALALAVGGLARFKSFKLASFFLLGTAATLVAWLKFCSGEKYVTWQPSRRV